MRFRPLAGLILGIAVLPVPATLGQSLGDLAREQQQKKSKAGSAASKKVITNEDLPAHTDADSDSSNSQETREDSYVPPATNDRRSAQQWKAAILQQKNAIAEMQRRVDDLTSSIHFVEANRYENGVRYNQHQLQKQQEVERMRKQLDVQKKRLDEMQEGARRAGFGSAIYDP